MRHWRSLLSFVAVAFLVTSSAANTPTPSGPPFSVTTEFASHPKIAVGSDGDFMVLWADGFAAGSDMHGRLFSNQAIPQGPAFVVQEPGWEYGYGNYASTRVGRHDVAAIGADVFVAVFSAQDDGAVLCQSDPCVVSRPYDDSGPTGPQTIVEQIMAPTYYATNSSIAQNDAQQFIVAWEGGVDTGGVSTSSEDVFGRVLDEQGVPTSPAFQANESFLGYQGDNGYLHVAGGPDGSFVVVWHDEYEGVGFRKISPAGLPIGPETFVSSTDCSIEPQVAFESGGNFLITWEEACTDSLRAHVFDPAGAPIGAEFEVAPLGSNYAAPAITGFPSDHFVIVWDTADRLMGQRLDSVGTPTGGAFDISVDTGSYRRADVDSDAAGNFVVVWHSYDTGTTDGQQFVVPVVSIEHPVLTTKLRIRDTIPDDPSKRKIKWVAKSEDITLPAPGSLDDPRCNGAPDGTAKATIRFSNDASGHDTGVIDLPCHRWSASGDELRRTYQYKDPKLFDGPCKFIRINAGRKVRARCIGGSPAAALEYDLETGTAESSVRAVLAMGNRTFCSDVPAFKGKNGADGKLFVGKGGSPGQSCP